MTNNVNFPHGDKSYDVAFNLVNIASEKTVVVNGNLYQILGSKESVQAFKTQFDKLGTTNFQSFADLEISLKKIGKPEGSKQEKTDSVYQKIIGIEEKNDLQNIEMSFGRKGTTDIAELLKALPKTANGAVDLTKLKKINEGGTHDVFVFNVKSFPYVIKVNRESLEMKNNEIIKKYNTDNAAYQTLHKSFGNHCTVEQLLLRNVSDGTDTKKALISIADYEVGFQKESKIGLQADDFTWSEMAVANNLNAYDDLLENMFFSAKPSINLSILEKINPNVAKIINLIGNKKEPTFRKAVQKFLTNFKDYFSKTGQYLDIAGRDNIIFFKDDKGSWTFKLGSVIKRETAEQFKKALMWLHEGSKETVESKHYMSIIRYCFHWSKALNTLALMAGMDKVITDNNIAPMWNDLEKAGITGKPSDPKRMLSIYQAVENSSADSLLGVFHDLDINPEKEVDCLLAILAESPATKKMVIAQYLHQVLPKISDNENFKFCYVRFHIALGIEKIPEGKTLAIECYEEVLKDPDGPHEEVLKAINKLNIEQ